MTDQFIEKLKSSLTSSTPEGSWKAIPAETITRLKALAKYTDLRVQLTKDVAEILKERNASSTTIPDVWMKNVLRIAGCLASKDNFGIDKFLNEKDPGASLTVEENYSHFKKVFSELWAEVMRWKMTPAVHKEVVILLPDRIMIHLTKPLHMSHFLLESFKMGGPVGLISLHGIFLLMQKYNFDVPDFYSKLYSLFTQDVLHSKYRARFFAYSRDFLTSTHLPEYLVAAFVKKLARLSLHAPAPAIPMICDFITNLMIEHPGTKTLVNRKPSRSSNADDEVTSAFENDPFDPDETDPLKCKAMESCLWEIKTLQHHILPSISLSSRFISKALPKVEKDLGETLSMSYDDLFEKERSSSGKLEPVPTHSLQVSEEDADMLRIFMGF